MSSDSSDEENLELLKEAQDHEFLNDSMFSKTSVKSSEKTSGTLNKETLPSLRKSKDEEEQFNVLKVTPEFRNYVARQLSSILDEKLKKQFVNVEVEEIPRKKRKKSGVKLLSKSNAFLETSESLEVNKSGEVQANSISKPSRYNKLKVEVSEEFLKEVAVSPEYILSKKEVETWSTRSKAHVFRYKKNKNGQFVQVEHEFKRQEYS